MTNKYRPFCSKMLCGVLADLLVLIDRFGPMYFCAKHGLKHLKEELV